MSRTSIGDVIVKIAALARTTEWLRDYLTPTSTDEWNSCQNALLSAGDSLD